MKTIITIVLAAASLTVNAQLPSLQWARNIGGSEANEVRVDPVGNVYTTGHFSGTKDFDPGPGTFFMSAVDIADDAYVCKLDANGNFLWAVQLGGSGTSYGNSLAVDAVGNVYTVGSYSIDIDADPGAGVAMLTSNGQSDMFISKLDANGNFVWARNIGGTVADVAHAAVLDLSGNICVTGIFNGVVDFDPGPGVASMNGGGNNDCFILKLDASGNFVMAVQTAGNYSQGDDITVDGTGNLYVCGVYTTTVDLDPGAGAFNVTSAGAGDVFVIKLDAAGNFIWGRSVGGIGTDNVRSLKVDASGNVYVVGNFSFTPDFDPGPGVFNVTAVGPSDAFLLKLDAAGIFAWVKIFSSTGSESARAVTTDALGNTYATGLFQATIDFDPGPGVFNLTSLGASNDIFIVKLDASGNFVWAVRFGGTTLDEGLSLFMGASGNLYAAGYFEEVIDFDPGPGSVTLNSATGNTFIINLGAGVALPLVLLDFSGKQAPAGNLLQWKTAQEINTREFEIEWSDNGQRFSTIALRPAAGNSNATLQYSYLHAGNIDGDNYYRLKMVDMDGRSSYSPVIRISNKPASPGFTVFPNPVADVAQLSIQALKKETIRFTIYSVDGKQVSSATFNLDKGNNRFDWNLNFIPAGKYFMKSESGAFKTIQFIKK
jgi:hypothetical protein